VADKAAAFAGIAHRIRIMGSLALSLCHLAAGRLDAVCSLKPYRSVDVAAAQLLVRECGLSIANADGGLPFGTAPLDLVSRSRVAAAGTDELCQLVVNGLSA
jgi:myo-inositol-1(or 4)-monophosphatase